MDVGARAEIYAILEELSEAGVGVLFASSDPEELLRLSDRVLVLHEGAIVAELEGDQLDEATVQAAVTGGGRAS